MKKSNRFLFPMWFLSLLNLIMLPQPVYASDAVSDIMNNERFQGAIESIEWLTGYIDYWFTMAISITAFFIISTALLKNALAGAYCANPKFWNSVAQAHDKAEAMTLAQVFSGFKQMGNMSAGGLKDAILGIIPNIKALTDFDDAEIEPKAYWMKAIPQMLGCVIIGVFIYNGYYRDVSATVGSFGSEICNRVFSSIDPVAFVDTLTQTTGTPENIYEEDETIEGKMLYEMSSNIYKATLSASKGLTETTAKTSLMRDSELVAYELISEDLKGSYNDKYNIFTDGTRTYDYTMSGLSVKIVSQIPGGQGGSGISTFQLKDTEDAQTIAVTGYHSVPSTAKEYIGEGQYIYYSYQLIGTPSDNSKEGSTSTTATAGDWAGSVLDPITIQYTCKSTPKTDGNGNAICNDDAVEAPMSLIQDKALKAIKAKITDLSSHSLVITNITLNGRYGGTAQAPTISMKGDYCGTTCEKGTIVITVKDASDNNKTYRFTASLLVEVKASN